MRRASKILAPFALALALAAPASAGAAGTPTGSTTLTVPTGKAKVLKKRGIALRGVRGVETAGRQSRLQIVGGEIGEGQAQLFHRGAMRLVAGKGKARRVVFLRGLRVHLGPASFLSAKLGAKRRLVFNLRAGDGALAINGTAGTAHLLNARAVWRPGPLRMVRRKLRAKVPVGALGTLQTKAAILLEQPVSQPVSEPPLLARPAGAVDVVGAGLTWHVRDSWVRYVGSEVAEPFDGATPLPKYPGENHPCPDLPTKGNELTYSYDVPFANGWYHAPTGTAGLYYRGGVRFAYPARGIDLTLHDPEIEINGAASRAIFRIKGSGATAYPDSRAAIMSLPGTSPVESPAGSFAFPDPLKAALTPDGEKVFAGFYAGTNNGFGCFAVSFTTG